MRLPDRCLPRFPSSSGRARRRLVRACQGILSDEPCREHLAMLAHRPKVSVNTVYSGRCFCQAERSRPIIREVSSIDPAYRRTSEL